MVILYSLLETNTFAARAAVVVFLVILMVRVLVPSEPFAGEMVTQLASQVAAHEMFDSIVTCLVLAALVAEIAVLLTANDGPNAAWPIVISLVRPYSVLETRTLVLRKVVVAFASMVMVRVLVPSEPFAGEMVTQSASQVAAHGILEFTVTFSVSPSVGANNDTLLTSNEGPNAS